MQQYNETCSHDSSKHIPHLLPFSSGSAECQSGCWCEQWSASLVTARSCHLGSPHHQTLQTHSKICSGRLDVWHTQVLWKHNSTYSHSEVCLMPLTDPILRAKHKTAVTPLLMHWSYCSLALSHQYSVIHSIPTSTQIAGGRWKDKTLIQ